MVAVIPGVRGVVDVSALVAAGASIMPGIRGVYLVDPVTGAPIGGGGVPPADSTPPMVISFSPLDNATGVSVSGNLVVTFNEAVTLGTGTINLKKTSDNSLIESWDVATEGGSTAGKVEVVSSTKLTMHLTTALANSIEHYMIWDAGVVKDLANNPVAAQASTTLWSFTTGAPADVTPPTVVSFSPLDNATGVSVSGNLVVTFNEAVTLGASGVITLKKTSDNSTVDSWNVSTAGGSTAGKVEVVGGTQLTMHLTTALANSVEYFVIWDAGVVVDLAANPVAVQASTTLWSFTTVSGSAYDPATDAIAAAFTTPPTTARKNLIDACVVSLKSAGVWAKLDALYAFAAADSQAGLINWKQPGTYNGVAVNSPPFVADRGFTGINTSYIETGFNISSAPSPQYTLNSASLFGWSNTAGGLTGALLGNSAGASNYAFVLPDDSINYLGAVNGGLTQVAHTVGTGLFVSTRTASNLTTSYRNGASFATDPTVSVALQSMTLRFIHRYGTYWLGQAAGGGFGAGLTAADNTALYNALRAYMTGVGVP